MLCDGVNEVMAYGDRSVMSHENNGVGANIVERVAVDNVRTGIPDIDSVASSVAKGYPPDANLAGSSIPRNRNTGGNFIPAIKNRDLSGISEPGLSGIFIFQRQC
jgi:hypothetical protein